MTESNDTAADTAIGSVMTAFFAAVTFRPGERPDYGRLHELVIADGLLIRNTTDTPDVSTVDEFIAPRQALVDSGQLTAFEEAELSYRLDVFGRVAQRRSAYRKRAVSASATTDGTGVILTQFIRTPTGWKISAMAWDDEP